MRRLAAGWLTSVGYPGVPGIIGRAGSGNSSPLNREPLTNGTADHGRNRAIPAAVSIDSDAAPGKRSGSPRDADDDGRHGLRSGVSVVEMWLTIHRNSVESERRVPSTLLPEPARAHQHPHAQQAAPVSRRLSPPHPASNNDHAVTRSASAGCDVEPLKNSGPCDSTRRCKAATTLGSNCVPAQRSSSSRAHCSPFPLA
jgi:hypothetical protein